MHPDASTPLSFPNGHLHYKVDANGCWIWQGTPTAAGYGQYRGGPAHRWYYHYYAGPIPAGMHVHHLCRVRACVNPAHMQLLTQQENLACAMAVWGVPAPLAPPRVPPTEAEERAALARRFERYVERTPECWLWTGATVPRGYGVFRLGGRAGRNVYAHRWSYEQANGPIEGGLFCLHRCDQPRCVRPEHLFVGTHAENMADQKRKQRNQYGEQHHAAKLTADDVRAIRQRAAAGERGSHLAEQYGLNPTTIWDIIHGHLWTHIVASIQPA